MVFRALSTLAALGFLAAFSFSQVKRVEPPAKQPQFKRSRQVVLVTTPEWKSVQGVAQLFERVNSRSKWKPVGDEFPVVVGRSGLGVFRPGFDSRIMPKPPEPIKHEGDGRAPAGVFPLTFVFGNSDVGSKLPFTKLDEFTECVDDTNSMFYNKVVNRMQVGNFDWKSSEKMFTVRPQYDLGVFVSYNSYPPIPGNGSCIFLHIWKDADTGTAGCTAMARENLERVVRWLDPAKHPFLVQDISAAHDLKSKESFLRRVK
jgi:L,D-peptidoglycan transpeptidase YkuD (ErfK/YbiS/YcfS/YnhG family)